MDFGSILGGIVNSAKDAYGAYLNNQQKKSEFEYLAEVEKNKSKSIEASAPTMNISYLVIGGVALLVVLLIVRKVF